MSVLTSAQRQAVRLQYEGLVLHAAGNVGAEGAAENAFCMIDGQVSGLLRIIGPEKTAEFLFPLLDRVVHDIRGMTKMPMALVKFQPEPGAAPEPTPESVTAEVLAPAEPAPRPQAWSYALVLAAIGFAFLAGFAFRGMGL